MNSAAMISCSRCCIQKGYIAAIVIPCLRIRLPMTDTEGQSLTTDVEYVAMCTTFSPTPFGAEVATSASPSSSSCVALSRARRRNTWPSGQQTSRAGDCGQRPPTGLGRGATHIRSNPSHCLRQHPASDCPAKSRLIPSRRLSTPTSLQFTTTSLKRTEVMP